MCHCMDVCLNDLTFKNTKIFFKCISSSIEMSKNDVILCKEYFVHLAIAQYFTKKIAMKFFLFFACFYNMVYD